jgi:hypothetical protein
MQDPIFPTDAPPHPSCSDTEGACYVCLERQHVVLGYRSQEHSPNHLLVFAGPLVTMSVNKAQPQPQTCSNKETKNLGARRHVVRAVNHSQAIRDSIAIGAR